MPDPLDLEPIKERLAVAKAQRKQHPHLAVHFLDEDGMPAYAPDIANLLITAPWDIRDLIAEVERLREERAAWRDASNFLSRRHQGDDRTDR